MSVLKRIFCILVATVLLCSCAVTPRVSSWNSPKGFTKSQVFNAAIQAGGQNGMKATASDRESGTMSFSKHIGKGDMILSVQVAEAAGIVNVQTTGNFAGDIAIRGLHEEVIRNFHVFLFRNLNIEDPSARNVRIEDQSDRESRRASGPQPTTAPPASQSSAPPTNQLPVQPSQYAAPPNEPSSSGQPLALGKDSIHRVQIELKTRGFDAGPADGAIGPKTREALRRFQNANRLRGTGEIDAATLKALGIR
jgi:hypothetical protein